MTAPPDTPADRLYDPKTRVFWAVDTFATPIPDAKMGIADLDEDFWYFGLTMFALGAVSPWISMTDPVKYGKHVDVTQNLDITTIAACHSPVIEGPYIEKAFAHIRTPAAFFGHGNQRDEVVRLPPRVGAALARRSPIGKP